MFPLKSKLLKYSGYLFTLAILLVLIVPRIFQEGRFMDGMIYGSVARNLSEGQGNIWQLYFSSTLLQPFHEHPPMAFVLESLVFSVLGDHYYVEGIYQLIMILLSAYLIFKIVKQQDQTSSFAWLAILLWITTERVFWCANENMLESTISFFALLSIYFLGNSVKSLGKTKLLYTSVAAIAVLCAFLSKGFVGLFPFAYFFFTWLVSKKQYSFLNFLKDTSLLAALLASFSLAIILIWDDAYDSIRLYLQQQVFNSVQGHDRVGLRLPFISGFFQQTILLIVLFVVVLFYKYKTKSVAKCPSSASLFFLVALSAFLPLLVSPKLSFYYLVPSIPYFSIALVLHASETLSVLLSSKLQLYFRNTALVLSLLIFVSTIILSITTAGTAARDGDTITEVRAISYVIAPGTEIAVSANLQEDWTLFAYMQRIGKLSAVKGENRAGYLLAEQSEVVDKNYVLLYATKPGRLALYKRLLK